jgi:hypothetical protein
MAQINTDIKLPSDKNARLWRYVDFAKFMSIFFIILPIILNTHQYEQFLFYYLSIGNLLVSCNDLFEK